MPEQEVWRPVVGFEARYSVSNTGKVMRTTDSLYRKSGSLCSLTYTKKDREYTGYFVVRLWKPCEKRNYTARVHRIVAEAFIGDIDGKEINHKNGNGADNRVENLEIVTTKENAIHARRVLGRGVGENNGGARLTSANVTDIISMHSSGTRQVDIARKFGVARTTINAIIKGRNWKHHGRADALLIAEYGRRILK